MMRRPAILNATMPSWMMNPPQLSTNSMGMPGMPSADPATQLVDNSMQVGREIRRRRAKAGILGTLAAGETGGFLGAAINSGMRYGA
jgi:hypothetical protein